MPGEGGVTVKASVEGLQQCLNELSQLRDALSGIANVAGALPGGGGGGASGGGGGSLPAYGGAAGGGLPGTAAPLSSQAAVASAAAAAPGGSIPASAMLPPNPALAASGAPSTQPAAVAAGGGGGGGFSLGRAAQNYLLGTPLGSSLYSAGMSVLGEDAVKTALDALTPLAPYLAGGAAVLSTASYAVQASLAAARPYRQMETSLLAANAAGGMIDPLQRQALLANTGTESESSLMDTLSGSVPGQAYNLMTFGLAGSWLNNGVRPLIQRRTEVTSALAESATTRRADALATGIDFMSPEERRLRASVSQHDADVSSDWKLRFDRLNYDMLSFVPGVRRLEDMASKSVTGMSFTERDAAAKQAAEDTQNADFEHAMVRALGPLAGGQGRFVRGFDAAAVNRAGISPGEAAGGLSLIAGTLGRPAYSELYRGLLTGSSGSSSPLDYLDLTLRQSASEGDIGAVWSSLGTVQSQVAQQHPGFTAAQVGAEARRRLMGYVGTALDAQRTQARESIAQSEGSLVGAHLEQERLSGKSMFDVAHDMRQSLSPLTEIRDLLREQLARTPAENRVDRAALTSAIAQYDNQILSARRGVRDAYYSAEEYTISTGQTRAGTALTRAIYGGGGFGAVSDAISGQQAVISRQIGVIDQQLADKARPLSPEERDRLNAERDSLVTQRDIGMERQRFDIKIGMEGSDIAVKDALRQRGQAMASVFGGVGQIADAGRAALATVADQIRLQQEIINDPHRSYTERQQAQAALTGLQTQYAVGQEEVTRQEYSGYTQAAFSRYGLATGSVGLAFGRGAGGVGASGLLDTAYSGAQSALKAAQAQQAEVEASVRKAGGDTETNADVLRARQAVQSAQQALVDQQRTAANAPISARVEEGIAQAQFSASVLSRFPGTLGSSQAAIRSIITETRKALSEVSQQEADAKRRQGGDLTDEQKLEFNSRRRDLESQEAGAYQQLSYGWQDRLVSSALNAPGSFAFLAPLFSNRTAIRNGVKNPFFGAASAGEVPAILKDAMPFISGAGATGTPDFFAATALSGVSPGFGGSAAAAPPVHITVMVQMPDGSTHPAQAQARVSNQQDTSPAALHEQAGRAGYGVGRQRG